MMAILTNTDGVENVESESDITIESGVGYITVKDVDTYTITSVSGVTVVSNSSTTNIAPGFYIVKAANKVEKVFVK